VEFTCNACDEYAWRRVNIHWIAPCAAVRMRKLRKAGQQRKRLRRLAKPPTTWAQDWGRIHGAGPQNLKAGKSARFANHFSSLGISLTAAPAALELVPAETHATLIGP